MFTLVEFFPQTSLKSGDFSRSELRCRLPWNHPLKFQGAMTLDLAPGWKQGNGWFPKPVLDLGGLTGIMKLQTQANIKN